MDILAGVIGSICYTCGSLVGIVNAITQFITIFKKLNITKRIKNRSYMELLKDDNMEKTIAALTMLLLFVFPIYVAFLIVNAVYKYTNGNFVICFINSICLFGVGVRWTKTWWEHIKTEVEQKKPIITFMPDGRFRDIAEKICISANIGYIDLYFIDIIGINAFTFKDKKNKRKRIIFTKSCETLSDNEIAALVGHEIAHLKNGDFDIIEKLRRSLGFIIVLAGFAISIIILSLLSQVYIAGIILTIVIVPVIIIYEVAMLIFFSIDDRRLWKQIQEIRADRVACTFEGVTQIDMISLLKKIKEQNNEKIAWYNKIYIKYFKVMEHPCLERRIYLIEKYKKWSILDYYLHAGQMFKWFITCKGWIGE